MVKQASLLSELESLLGPEATPPPQRLADFAVAGLVPQAVVAPAGVEQVAQVIRYASAQGLTVIPWGGGTHMHIGNVPRRYDIALSLSRLDQVLEHEPADLTATVQAGITLAALQRQLAVHDQMAPFGPPWNEQATIGGILAVNTSGPSRHAFGTARDFTIGLKVVTADGRITRAGGKVVKNVAGYDLCKLYVGSLGTLGVIVEATFKLAPLPKAERTLALRFNSCADACALAAELHRRGLSLRALHLLFPAVVTSATTPADRCFDLVLELAGSQAAVERSQREIDELARSLGSTSLDAHIERGALEPFADPFLFKATVLPAKLPALIDAFKGLDKRPFILAWPTVGVLYAACAHVNDAEEVMRHLRGLTSEAGGSLIIERCSPELKSRVDVFGDPPASFDLMRRIKQQFDPDGTLSPGRFVGRL